MKLEAADIIRLRASLGSDLSGEIQELVDRCTSTPG
jgi:hypothetical protein